MNETDFLIEPRPEENDWDFKIKIPQERGMQLQRLIDMLPAASIIYLNEGTYTIGSSSLSFGQDSPTVHVLGTAGLTTTIIGNRCAREENDRSNNKEWDDKENYR